MPVPFLKLIQLLEKIEGLQSNPRTPYYKVQPVIREHIFTWFSEIRADIARNPKTVLAIQSTLLPELRPDRVYNLREEALAKTLARSLLITGTRRERELFEWRTTTVFGDLGSAVQKVMRQAETNSKGGAVTVEELDDVLDKLACRSIFSNEELRKRVQGGSKLSETSDLLQGLFNRLSSLEGKWATRCILKSHLMRMPETATLEAYHFLLPKLYLVQNNLERACTQVCSEEVTRACPVAQPGSAKYHRWLGASLGLIKPEVGVKVGRGEFIKATSCRHAVHLAKGRKMLMERKYDGEYCQIHIDLSKGHDWIKIFSKSGKESTQDRHGIHDAIYRALKLGDLDECGFKEKCILEGELVVFNDRLRKIMPFHHLRSHVSRSGVFIGNTNDLPKSPSSHLMILLFDVLLLDDTPLLSLPLSTRLQRLQRVLVAPRRGYCQTTEHTEIDFSKGAQAAEQMKRYFARAIQMHWEGCILKPCDAPYFNLMGSRLDKSVRGHGFHGSNTAWIKLKKDYIEGLGDSADFAVIGGVANRERSLAMRQVAGELNTFHAAVLTNKAEVTKFAAKPRLKVVFEVTYSIKQEDLEWIQREAYFNAVEYKPGLVLDNYDFVFPSELQVAKPTHIFSRPLVFEVNGGGFEKQTNCAFFTPRHPRVSKVHWDREFTDVVSFNELQCLADDAMGADRGSQGERLWIAKLERGDVGRQLEETPDRSVRSEATPPIDGFLASSAPKRSRYVFSTTPDLPPDKSVSFTMVETQDGARDYSPLRKKQRHDAGGLFAKSFGDYIVAMEQILPDEYTPGSAGGESQPARLLQDSISAGTQGRCLQALEVAGYTPSRASNSNTFVPGEAKKHSVTTPFLTPRSPPSAPPPPTPFLIPSEQFHHLPVMANLSSADKMPPVPSMPAPSPFPAATLRRTSRRFPPPKEENPLPGATVYLTTRLLNRERIIERLIAHGIEVFDEFVTDNPTMPPYGAIVLVGYESASTTKNAIRSLEVFKLTRPEGMPPWEVWDWRVVNCLTIEELKLKPEQQQKVKWSLWKYFDC